MIWVSVFGIGCLLALIVLVLWDIRKILEELVKILKEK